MNELILKLGEALRKLDTIYRSEQDEPNDRPSWLSGAIYAFIDWKTAKQRTDATQLSVDGMAFWLGDQHNDDFETWEQNDNVLTFTFHEVTYTATIERVK